MKTYTTQQQLRGRHPPTAPTKFSKAVHRQRLRVVNFVTTTELKPDDVVILGVARTPLGNQFGSLSGQSAPQLGAAAIKGALQRAKVSGDLVDEMYVGIGYHTGLAQSPSVRTRMLAELPEGVITTSLSKACASGMKAVIAGTEAIQAGDASLALGVGMESMTNVPYILPKARSGYRMGHAQVLDSMLSDGLWDPFYNMHMGGLADLCAQKYGITREQADHHAVDSHQRAAAAQASGVLDWEIVTTSGVKKDEGPKTDLTYTRVAKLKPAFTKEGGVVTVANASGISDGAAAVVLSSWSKAQEMGLEPLARILGYADAQQDPKWFTTSPTLAIPKALKMANITDTKGVDYWEINEAFSAVDLANRKILGLPDDRVNVHGGAVALGHPIGCSGTRILISLLNVLRTHHGKVGCAAICNGGGGASAVVLELNEALHAADPAPAAQPAAAATA